MTFWQPFNFMEAKNITLIKTNGSFNFVLFRQQVCHFIDSDAKTFANLNILVINHIVKLLSRTKYWGLPMTEGDCSILVICMASIHTRGSRLNHHSDPSFVVVFLIKSASDKRRFTPWHLPPKTRIPWEPTPTLPQALHVESLTFNFKHLWPFV